MKDIYDGVLHHKLQTEIDQPFLTLTLHLDAIQPLLIINELALKRRFTIENII